MDMGRLCKTVGVAGIRDRVCQRANIRRMKMASRGRKRMEVAAVAKLVRVSWGRGCVA